MASLVGVIDEGTSKVAFSIFKTPDLTEVATHSIKIPMITQKDGWFEQDPVEILNAINTCATEACALLPKHNFSAKDIVSIGITNQRESTVIWDRESGKPLYNAIIWNDIRTTTTVDQVLAKLPGRNKNHFKQTAGLPVSPYFSALKIRWLIDNVPAVRNACDKHSCLAGTLDTWIVWHLTNGTIHVTDVTNASRTLLMNIETLQWDPELLKTFSIPEDILPVIRSSSEIYGIISQRDSTLNGIQISGIVGNQQAALLGQMCVKPGLAKSTYSFGCFLLCNIGEKPIISTRGLVTTVAYKMGKYAQQIYALEGSVAVAGHALEWLQNKVRLLKHINDAEKLAGMVRTTGDVYFVPAFTGLYAPYWRKEARGIICGITQFTNKNHVVRAALEAICFQTRDILECMSQETGLTINKIHSDGKLSPNDLLMQLQADTAGLPVYRSKVMDTTMLGAAICAASAQGIDLYQFDPYKLYYENIQHDVFLPACVEKERAHRYSKWKMAVERSFGWSHNLDPEEKSPEKKSKSFFFCCGGGKESD